MQKYVVKMLAQTKLPNMKMEEIIEKPLNEAGSAIENMLTDLNEKQEKAIALMQSTQNIASSKVKNAASNQMKNAQNQVQNVSFLGKEVLESNLSDFIENASQNSINIANQALDMKDEKLNQLINLKNTASNVKNVAEGYVVNVASSAKNEASNIMQNTSNIVHNASNMALDVFQNTLANGKQIVGETVSNVVQNIIPSEVQNVASNVKKLMDFNPKNILKTADNILKSGVQNIVSNNIFGAYKGQTLNDQMPNMQGFEAKAQQNLRAEAQQKIFGNKQEFFGNSEDLNFAETMNIANEAYEYKNPRQHYSEFGSLDYGAYNQINYVTTNVSVETGASAERIASVTANETLRAQTNLLNDKRK